MSKLKNHHFPLIKSGRYYEEDPDAAALEISIESGLIGSVQQALTHADDDSLFGDCVVCRQPIAEQRLKQLPWAAYCNDCDPSYGEQNPCSQLPQAA